MKKTIELNKDEFWELLNKALELFGSDYGLESGTYDQELQTSVGDVKLILRKRDPTQPTKETK